VGKRVRTILKMRTTATRDTQTLQILSSVFGRQSSARNESDDAESRKPTRSSLRPTYFTQLSLRVPLGISKYQH
jgi:hypothetical protein